MTTELVKFNLDVDNDNASAVSFYTHDSVQKVEIMDTNQGSYPGAFVNFNNVNIQGSSYNRFLQWSEGYLSIPYSFVTTLTNLTTPPSTTSDFGFDPGETFKYAISPKPYHHFIDKVDIKMNGIAVNRGANRNNFYINEQLKRMNRDEYEVVGDLINLKLDSAESIDLVDRVGEVNNKIHRTTATPFLLGDLESTNIGFYERCKKGTDTYQSATSSLMKFGGNKENLLTNSHYSGVYHATANKIIYNGTAYIPLKYVHPFFEMMPSTASCQGFELKLQLNLGEDNEYKQTYSGTFACQGVTVIRSNGNTCPFMISEPSVDTAPGSFPITVGTTTTPGFTLTTKTYIGWRTNAGERNTGTPACKIVIPTVNYEPSISKSIVQSKPFTHVYRDFHFEIDENANARPAGTSVYRTINSSISRGRTLYIIPYLSPTSNVTPYRTPVSPYLSPLSSAPTTCSPCRLKNFQFKIGGTAIFERPLQYNEEYYRDHMMSLYAHVNGNSLKSLDFGTLVTLDRWIKGGYNVYAIDLKRVLNEASDISQKQFDIEFQIDGTSADLKYDFLYIVDFESTIGIERGLGTIAQ